MIWITIRKRITGNYRMVCGICGNYCSKCIVGNGEIKKIILACWGFIWTFLFKTLISISNMFKTKYNRLLVYVTNKRLNLKLFGFYVKVNICSILNFYQFKYKNEISKTRKYFWYILNIQFSNVCSNFVRISFHPINILILLDWMYSSFSK